MGLQSALSRLFSRATPDPDDPALDEAAEILGYRFRDPTLLALALTHRSYARGNNHDIPSNERLEYLGDSVLGATIAEQLYNDFPEMPEGDLTKTRAMLVNENTLAEVGQRCGLHGCIRLSAEEDRAGGRERPSIISDAFESVIGAVFLDGGYAAARDLVLRLLYPYRDEIIADASQRNYKGELLELMQSRAEGMPRYEVVSETGPDHLKVFEVAVMVNGTSYGVGTGQSKKEAEQKAAAEALRQLTDED
jgi:ribonuclease-3